MAPHSMGIRELLEREVGEPEETPTTPTPEPASTPESEPSEPAEKPTPVAEPQEAFSKFETQLLKGRNTSGWTDAQKREWVDAQKDLVRGWHGSQREYADAKRLVDALSAAGISPEDLSRFVSSRKNGVSPVPIEPVTKETARVIRGIDRLIEEATEPEVKEQLRKSKQTILEEMEQVVESRLSTRMKPFEEKLARLEGLAQHYSQAEANAEIDALEDVDGYPVELVETYRDQLVRFRVAYPTLSREEVLFKVVPAKTLKAHLTSAPEPTSNTPRPKAKSAGKTPTVNVESEESETSSKHIDKKGRVSNLVGFTRESLARVLGG